MNVVGWIVDNRFCSVTLGGSTSIDCSGTSGQFVFVGLSGSSRTLTVCEVQVKIFDGAYRLSCVHVHCLNVCALAF